jgi:hypothetical protein
MWRLQSFPVELRDDYSIPACPCYTSSPRGSVTQSSAATWSRPFRSGVPIRLPSLLVASFVELSQLQLDVAGVKAVYKSGKSIISTSVGFPGISG